MLKIILYQIFTNCEAQIGPTMKNAQNLLKFDKNWNLIKIFDKNYFCEIGIFEMSNVSNFNEFEHF